VSVCVSVRGRMPTLLLGPGCNLGSGRGCPLVVHYWADLRVALLWQQKANRSYNLAFVSDIAVFLLKSDVKLQPTNQQACLHPAI